MNSFAGSSGKAISVLTGAFLRIGCDVLAYATHAVVWDICINVDPD